MLTIFLFLCFFSLIFFSSIVVHEFGHILIGVLMRFKLVYVEVFGIRIETEHKFGIINNKFSFNAKTVMYPIGIKGIRIRQCLYYLGGIFANVIMALVGMLLINNPLLRIGFLFIELIILLLAIVPYRNSDFYNIGILLNYKKCIPLLMRSYTLNGILPSEMPKEWFAISEKEPYILDNLYMHRIRYYRMLECVDDIHIIKEEFLKMLPLFTKSKYLIDKCEVLFYYVKIDKDIEKAKYLIKILEPYIIRSNLSSKKRLLLAIYCLKSGEEYKAFIKDMDEYKNSRLEKIIIDKFAENKKKFS